MFLDLHSGELLEEETKIDPGIFLEEETKIDPGIFLGDPKVFGVHFSGSSWSCSKFHIYIQGNFDAPQSYSFQRNH
jgi:hypothetical protein